MRGGEVLVPTLGWGQESKEGEDEGMAVEDEG